MNKMKNKLNNNNHNKQNNKLKVSLLFLKEMVPKKDN